MRPPLRMQFLSPSFTLSPYMYMNHMRPSHFSMHEITEKAPMDERKAAHFLYGLSHLLMEVGHGISSGEALLNSAALLADSKYQARLSKAVLLRDGYMNRYFDNDYDGHCLMRNKRTQPDMDVMVNWLLTTPHLSGIWMQILMAIQASDYIHDILTAYDERLEKIKVERDGLAKLIDHWRAFNPGKTRASRKKAVDAYYAFKLPEKGFFENDDLKNILKQIHTDLKETILSTVMQVLGGVDNIKREYEITLVNGATSILKTELQNIEFVTPVDELLIVKSFYGVDGSEPRLAGVANSVAQVAHYHNRSEDDVRKIISKYPVLNSQGCVDVPVVEPIDEMECDAVFLRGGVTENKAVHINDIAIKELNLYFGGWVGSIDRIRVAGSNKSFTW